MGRAIYSVAKQQIRRSGFRTTTSAAAYSSVQNTTAMPMLIELELATAKL